MPWVHGSRCRRRVRWTAFQNAIAVIPPTGARSDMVKAGAARRVRKGMALPKDPAARRARVSLPRASRG